MANTFFKFKSFVIEQKECAMKVTTDACLFGAWIADQISDQHHILDIGGGTGLLSLMLAQRNSIFNITSVEIEKNCFQQLKENINQSTFAHQITPVHANIVDFKSTIKFNAIVSNPPFYEKQLKSNQSAVNQARHEESLSLKNLLEIVDAQLDNNGIFYVLLPFYRKEETIQLAKQYGLNPTQITEVKQTPSHQPFRVMFSFEKRNQVSKENEITIADSNSHYTTEFVSLLKDYYLYL
jgi:tRNA1Val (adenine37-N6)-methyltransferase